MRRISDGLEDLADTMQDKVWRGRRRESVD